MEDAKKKRTSAKRMFTMAEATLKRSLEDEEAVEATVQRRFEDFRQKWNSLLEAHGDYADAAEGITKNEGELVDPNIDSWIEELVGRFEALEIEADKKLAKLNTPVVPISAESSKTIQSKTQSAIKVEKAKFPPFDGQLRKFPQFKKEFNDFIKAVDKIIQEKHNYFNNENDIFTT